ncbi:MAG: hypothetical protein EAZ15_00750 [Sphingobacteriales bacterium]|nr:MAG: hypothetical protein EAZ15_00750 [Sphingobacteriales bacterium]
MNINRYQYIFAIALLMLIHVSIMFFWLEKIEQPTKLNALNTSATNKTTNQTQFKPIGFYFINY